MLTKKIIAAALALGVFTFAPNFYYSPLIQVAQAEVKMYTGIGKCVQGDLMTEAQSKKHARDKAEIHAIEQAGVYISSYTEVKNNNLTKNDIQVLTNSILNIVGDVQYTKAPFINDGVPSIVHTATLKANIDTNGINAYIQRNKQLNLKSAQDDIKVGLNKIDTLNEQYSKATSQSERNKIRNELSQVNKELLAQQKFEEGNKIFARRSYEKGHEFDQKAIELYTEAIKLNPNYADAYSNRGRVYSKMIRYDQAIYDCNRAIEINPNNARAYYVRGGVYSDLAGEYNIYGMGLGEYNKIKYTVDDSEFYNRAIADYTKAITLNPNYAWAYNNLGYVYHRLNQYTMAIVNYTKAIELDPNNPTYYNNREEAYKAIGDTEKALADNKKFTKLAFPFSH